MAKLSARGRFCLTEVTREYTAEHLQTLHDRYQRSYVADYVDGSDLASTVWERKTRRLMSDGSILEKLDIRFRPDPLNTWDDPSGRRHSYGWKVHAKVKPGVTAAEFARIYTADDKHGRPSAWRMTQAPIGRVAKELERLRAARHLTTVNAAL